MQLPSKIVDITMPLDNETVVDPEIMRPQIKYVNHQENAETMANFFDGMKPEDHWSSNLRNWPRTDYGKFWQEK